MKLRDVKLSKEELKALVSKYMIDTYERFDFVAETAKDMYLYDENGEGYLDFYGGIAVNSAGNCNEKVVEAVKEQVEDIIHTFNYPYTIPQALLAKMPIGAICATEEVAKAFNLGAHGTTYGGNPVCCAASYAQINELLNRDLAGNAEKMGTYFSGKLKQLPHVVEVRGKGLLVGVQFDQNIAAQVKHDCLDKKLLITSIGGNIIRMVPPLILDEKDCDKAFEIIKEVVEKITA